MFQDVRGDVASWEKEEFWETVGDVKIVTLRWIVILTTNIILTLLGRRISALRQGQKEGKG